MPTTEPEFPPCKAGDKFTLEVHTNCSIEEARKRILEKSGFHAHFNIKIGPLETSEGDGGSFPITPVDDEILLGKFDFPIPRYANSYVLVGYLK